MSSKAKSPFRSLSSRVVQAQGRRYTSPQAEGWESLIYRYPNGDKTSVCIRLCVEPRKGQQERHEGWGVDCSTQNEADKQFAEFEQIIFNAFQAMTQHFGDSDLHIENCTIAISDGIYCGQSEATA